MRVHILERSQSVDRPVDQVFAFFADAGNLEILTPPWLNFSILTPRPIEMRSGTLIDYRLGWGLIPIRWRTEIREWTPPTRFVDVQLKGPYRLWEHTHTFESTGAGTKMTDIVRYALPLGPLGWIAHQLKVRRDLERIFDYRAQQVAARFC